MNKQRTIELVSAIDRQFGARPFTKAEHALHWRTADALIEAGYLETVVSGKTRADENGYVPLRRTSKACPT